MNYTCSSFGSAKKTIFGFTFTTFFLIQSKDVRSSFIVDINHDLQLRDHDQARDSQKKEKNRKCDESQINETKNKGKLPGTHLIG